MLLNVKIHVLVKIEVLVVSLISEGLQHGHNGVPGQDNLLSAKEESVQGPVEGSPTTFGSLIHFVFSSRKKGHPLCLCLL